MENKKISSPHYLEAYDYSYSVLCNKMEYKRKCVYYSLDQVLTNSPERGTYEFPITFVNVKNDEKVMHRYVVYGGTATEVYEGYDEYRKTRVFVVSGISDNEVKSPVFTVHVGYGGLCKHLIGMEFLVTDFDIRVIDWEYGSDPVVNSFNSEWVDYQRIGCLDFMANLYRSGVEKLNKEDLMQTIDKCVEYGFMKETSSSVYLKDILVDGPFETIMGDLPF